MSLKQK